MAAERWCVGLRVHGRIDPVTYQMRMGRLADGQRTTEHTPAVLVRGCAIRNTAAPCFSLLIVVGFLPQRPTIPTLIMFRILAYVYARLARSEEREVADRR